MADEPIEEPEAVETTPEGENENDKVEDDPKPFDGEFDPDRARRTIDRLREEVRDLKKKKDAPKEDPEKDALTLANLQLKVALETGLNEKQASRLRGTTREEMLEDAADLFETFAPREERKTDRPRPVLKGGSQPEKEPEMSARDIVAAARRR